MIITNKSKKKCSVNLQYITKCKVVLNHEPYESAKDIIASVQKKPNIKTSQHSKKSIAVS